MVTKEKAKEKVLALVEEFSSKSREELDKKPEEQIKWDFIEPLLRALGWEKSDILKEKRILKGRADYILKIGNQEVAVIEAKKTNVRLTEEEGRQAVSYAYHRRVKFAILTNFKEVRFYHALSNIKNINKNLLKNEKGYLWLEYKDFEKDFETLWFLSKESFERGLINKLLSKKDERLARSVDESILKDLLEIREILTKDLKKLRAYLGEEKIDEAIQILIDRLIFMRSVEDRGLENKNYLLGLVKDSREGRLKKKLWYVLDYQFKEFDKNYNSKLFAPSILENEKDIFFDDGVLEKVIRILYFGSKDQQARYMFDEIPGDLLGSIYEQYLGVVLRGTEKRVTLDLESGKRKKMGIYYTPSYIVEYIVKNTVGEYIKNKSIDKILEVKIVDPACGSGSFLVRAFEEICNTIEEKLKKKEIVKAPTFKKYENKLNLAQKVTILTRCIYGVDLDEKAVELAQLNLLLKLLEDEKRTTRKHLLPNLKDNIKNGNSLIDDSKIAGDKAFNWHAQFPEVFREGGFDVVIGNPPYIRVDEIPFKDKEYFSKIYETPLGKFDIYFIFIEKGYLILKNGGKLGFIVPNRFLVGETGKNLRDLLLTKSKIKRLLDLSELKVFRDANVHPIIMIFEKENHKLSEESKILSIFNIISEKNFDKDPKCVYSRIPQHLMIDFGNLILNKLTEKDIGIMAKLIKNKPLIEISEISEGLHTGDDKKMILLDKNIKQNESGSYLKIIRGSNIKRYYLSPSKEFIFKKYIKTSRREKRMLEQNKIVLMELAPQITASIDTQKNICLGSIYFLTNKEKYSSINLRVILALINSKLLNYFYRKVFATTHWGSSLKYRSSYLEKLPVKLFDKKQEQKITGLVDQMLELQKKFHHDKITGREKELLEQQIKNIDYEIDQEVYKLYGITSEEQKIIEADLK